MISNAEFLLLGAGKVTSSVARLFPENSLCLTETQEGLELLRWSSQAAHWELLEKFKANFDQFDFDSIRFDKILLSPGISTRRSFFKSTLQEKEIREMDLFKDIFAGKTFVITGTNGKSTATFQIGQVFEKLLGKEKVFVGGNLGTPALDIFRLRPHAEWAILEVSSYQAERLKSANFDFGLLLNLSPDHLDRYSSVEEYYQAKWNLLSRCRHIFYPQDLVPSVNLEATKTLFQTTDDWNHVLKKIVHQLNDSKCFGEKTLISENLLIGLERLPHRLEPVLVSTAFDFINDSKATNVESVLYALSQTKAAKRRHLILGGIAKGDDFAALKSQSKENDRVWIYGRDRHLIESQIRAFSKEILSFEKLDELLDQLLMSLEPKDLVLLSPGCASFDQFLNFEDRGSFFKAKIQKFFQTSSK